MVRLEEADEGVELVDEDAVAGEVGKEDLWVHAVGEEHAVVVVAWGGGGAVWAAAERGGAVVVVFRGVLVWRHVVLVVEVVVVVVLRLRACLRGSIRTLRLKRRTRAEARVSKATLSRSQGDLVIDKHCVVWTCSVGWGGREVGRWVWELDFI